MTGGPAASGTSQQGDARAEATGRGRRSRCQATLTGDWEYCSLYRTANTATASYTSGRAGEARPSWDRRTFRRLEPGAGPALPARAGKLGGRIDVASMGTWPSSLCSARKLTTQQPHTRHSHGPSPVRRRVVVSSLSAPAVSGRAAHRVDSVPALVPSAIRATYSGAAVASIICPPPRSPARPTADADMGISKNPWGCEETRRKIRLTTGERCLLFPSVSQ